MKIVTAVPYRGYVVVAGRDVIDTIIITIWHTGLEVERIDSGTSELAPALIEAKRIIDGWLDAP